MVFVYAKYSDICIQEAILEEEEEKKKKKEVANVLFLTKNGRFPNWTTGGAVH